MRTDSNTVLSLSPSVPPKKAALAKASSESGAAFAKDFNHAKDARSAKKDPIANDSTASSEASSTPSSSESSLTSTTSTHQPSTSVKGESKGVDSASGSSDDTVTVTNSTTESGNALQLDGEKLPDQSVSVSAETSVAPLSEAKEWQPESKEWKLGPKELQKVDADPIPALPIGDNVSGMDDSLVGQKEATGLVAMSGAVAGSEGVLGSGAVKQMASDPLGKASLPLVDADNSVLDPSLEQGNGELSWVLSQMDASALKAVPKEATESVVLDAGKTASATLAAGVLVNAANKESRADVAPSALLGSATDTSLSSEVTTDSAETLLGEDGVLINEPIELRKKEQEAMIGRMSAQLDGKAVDDAAGGLNSSLQNNASRAAVGVAAATVVAQNPQQNLAMSVPPGHPGWAGEMTQKVAWIARDGGHTAHIRLDPPELGSLTVKISVDSDSNAQVSFIAATPQARDLLEGQMARLREMLAQQGMDLSRADVDVSQQDASGAQERGSYRNSGANQGGMAANEDLENELVANNVSYVSASGVDYYA